MLFYDFPSSLSLDEVRRVVADHNERLGVRAFIEAERGEHSIFNYVISFDGMFPQPDTGDASVNRDYAILRECRGLVFDRTYGVVVSRRYHKFFNVNEKSFTQAHLIDWTLPHVILEKLDGSMIAPYPHSGRPGGIAWGTKMGVTDQSYPVEAFVESHPEYRSMFFDLYDRGFTPIFEWCSRQMRIVIDYKVERLVLTAVRSIHSGQYSSQSALEAIGQTYGVPVVRALPGTAENIEQFMTEAYDLEGAEGYVIRFDNGHMLKIKGRWYSMIHGTKENLCREKLVWQMILNDTVDDVKPFMDDEDRVIVDNFIKVFEAAIRNFAASLTAIADAAHAQGMSKKDFAEQVKQNPDRRVQGLLHAVHIGRDPIEVVKVYLTKNCFTGTQINSVRDLLGGLNWDHYRNNYVPLDG